jgi:hypothetical protein
MFRSIISCFVSPALVMLVASVAPLSHATSTTYDFYRITNNSSSSIGNQLGSQLRMTVEQAANGALFTFHNDVGIKSSITDIYFDDMIPKLFQTISMFSDSGGGVSFDSKASPSNLPGGNSMAVKFTADWSGDSDSKSTYGGVKTSGVKENGVNQLGEWVSFFGLWAGSATFGGLMNALNSGDFRVGLHVQAIGTAGTSDSYVNQLNPVPLPAAAWLFGSALVGFVMLSNRRKV